MSIFYACSCKHVKRKVRNSSCACLLGHAKVNLAMGKINKAAQMLSKLGASKGGKARAKTLTPEQRKAIAQKAAKARWGKPKKTEV
jgi:hypothetical protein